MFLTVLTITFDEREINLADKIIESSRIFRYILNVQKLYSSGSRGKISTYAKGKGPIMYCSKHSVNQASFRD